MKATQILTDEHRVIEQVLCCLEKMANRSESEGRIDTTAARDAVSFFRAFADRCHHGKEEDQLFPMMEARGFPAHEGPVAVMRTEHEKGRALVQRLDDSIDAAAGGDADACGRFVEAAREYVSLLREHIQKEDHCLFPMADQALTPADQRELLDRFEQVEHEGVGEGIHDTCLRVANALADRFGVPRATLSTGKVATND